MKLEVGKFIQTPYGIRKIVNITKDDGYGKPKVRVIELDRHLNTPYKFDYIFYTDENVIKKCKASYNIIDILEVGDILVDDTNRKLEILLIDNELMVRNTGLIYDNNYYLPIKSIAIKSVITHEQIEKMAYKVGE